MVLCVALTVPEDARMGRTRWLVLSVALLSACGGASSSASTTTAVGSSTVSVAKFSEEVQSWCFVIDDRAYQDVQKVYPGGAAPTPERRAEEARIRAQATDELVTELRKLAPPADLAGRWEGILTGLVSYADHERSLAIAIEAGAPEPERPDGLQNFRELGLGGKCDDWLDMN